MSKRTYPDRHPPGSHWSTDVAYQILNALPDGKIDDLEYAYIAGLIAAALDIAAEDGPFEPGAPPPQLK